ncbi:hypothetical protein IHE45_19G041600 [Dioscorea alata]|uniref:Uncharacterized protein n=1 Tax=Dioscorea alata TaxID=55571 RepID=A0ACB7TXP5_DIOAL|nr:hypothetical protein IHE45_19G041600 [Dioscorea alata]
MSAHQPVNAHLTIFSPLTAVLSSHRRSHPHLESSPSSPSRRRPFHLNVVAIPISPPPPSSSSGSGSLRGQFQFSTGFPQDHLAHNRNLYSPSIYSKNFCNVNYVNGGLSGL